jgi:hypothetical protein
VNLCDRWKLTWSQGMNPVTGHFKTSHPEVLLSYQLF